MWLLDVLVKCFVVVLVLSMLLCVFGVVFFIKFVVCEMLDIESFVVLVFICY